jgi:hypothetical protein
MSQIQSGIDPPRSPTRRASHLNKLWKFTYPKDLSAFDRGKLPLQRRSPTRQVPR